MGVGRGAGRLGGQVNDRAEQGSGREVPGLVLGPERHDVLPGGRPCGARPRREARRPDADDRRDVIAYLAVETAATPPAN